MKVLIIGSGGREHALAWKLKQSARISKIYCSPGNGGIASAAECVPADPKSLDSLIALGNKIRPDLTVIGPETPLQIGVVDEFLRRGWRIFGPTKAAAQLESSKSFAKEFMQRHRVPTAGYAICNSLEDFHEALPRFHMPVVVKADGLAAGKGVVICQTRDEAALTAGEMLSGKMVGVAGSRLVIEEYLEGEEISFLVLTDGERITPLLAAQDHKRLNDGNRGPNTGGMGAYCTNTLIDQQMQNWLLQHVARPVIDGMKAEDAVYKGILYCGLMMTAKGPMVLEFNCRFGDPETQPILMRLESDLLDALEAAVDGRVSEGDFRWSNDASVCVVVSSGGYPGVYEIGKKISGVEEAEAVGGVKVFHSGTAYHDGAYYTAGGRVLGVTAKAPDLKSALDVAYEAVAKVNFEGAHYRKDIAARALEK